MSRTLAMRQGEWGPAVPAGAFTTTCFAPRAFLQADARASCTLSSYCSQDSCLGRSYSQELPSGSWQLLGLHSCDQCGPLFLGWDC